MPEYLAPGVFVEETSFRHKSIEGVGTSVASLVGPTRSGPVRGIPEVVTSYAEFERVFGDGDDLSFGDGAGGTIAQPNYCAHAARAFFDNGGKQLYAVRAVRWNADGTVNPATASSAGAVSAVRFNARFPGALGNYALELHWQDSENLFTTTEVNASEEGDLLYLDARNVPATAKTTGPATSNFPMDVQAVVRRTGEHYVVQGTAQLFQPGTTTPVPSVTTSLAGLVVANLEPSDTTLTRLAARRPASGVLADGTAAVLSLAAGVDLTALNSAWDLGGLTRIEGYLDAAGTSFTVAASRNPGLPGSSDIALPLAAFGGRPAAITGLTARFFDLDVHKGHKDGEVIWSVTGASVAPGTERSLDALLPADPERTADQLSQPVSATLGTSPTGPGVRDALDALYNPVDLNPPAGSLDDPRHIVLLTGGSDGRLPTASDYAGEEDETQGSTGFKALESVEDVSICMAPAAAADTASHVAVVMEMQKHCRRMRYRVGVVDAREGMSLGDVREFRNNFDDSRLALYYPWVVATDPTGRRRELALPPSGFMAGIYADTDVRRGVHKAPANEVVVGALRFAQEINRFQQELLNPNGINCLRSFPGRGHRVWGGRTLSSDPEWKYLNVRRYFLYLERSIEKSTQWAVFEPNGEALWANIRAAVEDFLFNEWRGGALLGATPKQAFFVRCDRSTMTQNDIDNGRMVCVVGVAALKPAEFVIFRIGQKTADA